MHTIKPDFIMLARAFDIQCVYDCGSRDALNGLELVKSLNARELHVFECNPDALKLCEKNLRSYEGPAQLYLNRRAVSEKEGELEFYSIDPSRTVTDWLDGNIGASSLYPANPAWPYEKYVYNKIRVTSVSLDRYCRTHTPPDLLWMDLQGAEVRALEGAAHILPQVKLLHTEVCFRPLYIGQSLYWDIHKILRRQFKLVRLYDVRSRIFLRLNSLLNREKWFTDAVYVNRNYLHLIPPEPSDGRQAQASSGVPDQRIF